MAGWAFVQEAHNFLFLNNTQPTLTMASNVTKGNLLIAYLTSNSPTYHTISDFVNSNPYGIDGGVEQLGWIPILSKQSGGAGVTTAWYCIARRTGPCSVQFYDANTVPSGGLVGVPANLTYPACQIVEFSGNSLNPLDQSSHASGSGTAPASAVSATLANELIIGIGTAASGSAITVGGGYTSCSGTTESIVYATQTSSGSYTPAMTQSPTGSWGAISVSFLLAPIGNTISGALGAGGAGATVFVTSQTTGAFTTCTADGSGNYTSASLPPDTYSVQPQLLGQLFSPMRTTGIAVTSSNVTGQNFTTASTSNRLQFTTSASDSMNRANENPLSDGGVWVADGTPAPPFDPQLQLVNPTTVLTQTASDNFTRANENPLSDGGMWVATETANHNAGQVLSDYWTTQSSAQTSAGYAAALYGTSGAALTDSYSTITLATLSSANIQLQIICRGAVATNATLYQVQLLASGSGGLGPIGFNFSATIYKYIANSGTTGSTLASFKISVGDTLTFAVTGSGAATTCSFIHNGVTVLTWVDSSGTHIASGYSGFGAVPAGSGSVSALQVSGWACGTVSMGNGQAVLSNTTVVDSYAGPWQCIAISEYTGITWPTNQWAEIQIPTLSSATLSWAGVGLGIQYVVSTGAGIVGILMNNGDGTCEIMVQTFASGGGLAPSRAGNAISWVAHITNQTFTIGDKFRLAVVGYVGYVIYNGTVIANFPVAVPAAGNVILWIAGHATTDSGIQAFLGGLAKIAAGSSRAYTMLM
jgi:hypothetical protein